MYTELARLAAARLRRGSALLCVALLGLAALGWASFGEPPPRLTYNPTDSVAIGWYRIERLERHPSESRSVLPVESIVLVKLPAGAAKLADQRGYLPERIPLLKRVAAIWPQTVCIEGLSVRIDGALAATVLEEDRAGRPLQAWRQCRRLEPGELFLLSATNPASFDSRYFGPVDVSAVIGIAHPLWLRRP